MISRPNAHHRLAAALLLLALLLRGLVPTGWMPMVGADGAGLVICSSAGATAAPDDIFLPGEQQAPVADHSPCAFAGLGTPLLPTAFPLAFSFAAILLTTAPATGPPAAPASPRDRLRPPAQAPPTLR